MMNTVSLEELEREQATFLPAREEMNHLAGGDVNIINFPFSFADIIAVGENNGFIFIFNF